MKIVPNLVNGRRNFIAEVSPIGETTTKVIVISDNDDNTDNDDNGEKVDISACDVQIFLQAEGYTVYDITSRLVV